MRRTRHDPRYEVLPGTCKLCPNKVVYQQAAGADTRMATYRACRSCDFWLTCLGYMMLGDQDPDGRRVLRIDGRHYLTWTKDQGLPPEIGYAGSWVLHYTLLDDPRETVHATEEVWLMGTIPDHFRARMPDNAVFVPPG